MKKTAILITFLALLLVSGNSYSQDSTRTGLEIATFTVLQLIPFPNFISDASPENKTINVTLRWQVVPLNFSFRANKYVSPFQFFMVNPARRFAGSVEFFAQPEYSLGNTPSNSGLSRFTLGTGMRLILPLKNQGETYAASLGVKYNLRKDVSGACENNYFGIEGGVYIFFGLIGIQANYNFDERARYSVGLYFKYF